MQASIPRGAHPCPHHRPGRGPRTFATWHMPSAQKRRTNEQIRSTSSWASASVNLSKPFAPGPLPATVPAAVQRTVPLRGVRALGRPKDGHSRISGPRTMPATWVQLLDVAGAAGAGTRRRRRLSRPPTPFCLPAWCADASEETHEDAGKGRRQKRTITSNRTRTRSRAKPRPAANATCTLRLSGRRSTGMLTNACTAGCAALPTSSCRLGVCMCCARLGTQRRCVSKAA